VDQHDGLAGAMILVVDPMSALFSWPTVTVGMGLPSAGEYGQRLRGDALAHLICRVVLALASRSGGRVAPVAITGRCPGLRSGPRQYSLGTLC
jgi:hypothetical protein